MTVAKLLLTSTWTQIVTTDARANKQLKKIRNNKNIDRQKFRKRLDYALSTMSTIPMDVVDAVFYA